MDCIVETYVFKEDFEILLGHIAFIFHNADPGLTLMWSEQLPGLYQIIK